MKIATAFQAPCFSDITVVVQGPVHNYQGRSQEFGITHQCLNSIRRHLPGAQIILSSWEGQDFSGLDADIVLFNRDPGTNITGYDSQGNPIKGNFNRQIVSSSEGLKRASTRYAVKIRSDNYLTGSGFVNAPSNYSKRCESDCLFMERVVVNTTYFRRYAQGRKVVRHPSDFFHFGRREDLLKIWDLPFFPDVEFDSAKSANSHCRGSITQCINPEQAYCDAWLQHLDKNIQKLQHRYHITTAITEQWNRFMASNFVILEPEQIGLGLAKRFIPKSKRPDEMSHMDWQLLYQRYCDPDFPRPYFDLLIQLGWKRLLKIPFSYIKNYVFN